MRRGHLEAGNATVIALLATFMLAGLGAGLASVSFAFNRTGMSFDSNVLATYAAEAGMEEAVARIGTSDYPTPAGNEWLLNNAIGYDANRDLFPDVLVDVPVIEDLILDDQQFRKDVRIDVWVYAMDPHDRGYRVVARAVAGKLQLRPGAVNAWEVQGDVVVTLAQDIRARDTFARYATFVDQGTLAFGTTKVAGDVHSNTNIQFHYGGAKFLNKVTAVNGFQFKNGASTANTSFNEQDPSVKKIDLPSVTDVAEFTQFASGPYNVSVDAQIELQGDQVKITAIDPSTQAVVAEGTYPLPDDGVIYVQGKVTSIQGSLRGRLTISTPQAINITGNILYTDAEGDPAMRLEKDGQPVDAATENVPWKESDGYKYTANPDYDGEGTSLGLMAGQEISLDGDGPNNLEIHGALFSASKNWRADLNKTKGNLRIFGSTTTRTPGARAQGLAGYGASGEYIYDTSLLDNPPPQWLPVNKLFLGPRWRM
jgi:hypothetical protein